MCKSWFEGVNYKKSWFLEGDVIKYQEKAIYKYNQRCKAKKSGWVKAEKSDFCKIVKRGALELTDEEFK